MPIEPIKADVTATIRFLSAEEGGRSSVTPPEQFACILTYEGENFDCRLLLKETGPITPGDQVRVPVVFLWPELIKPKLSVGSHFTLRDFRIIAEGRVEEIY